MASCHRILVLGATGKTGQQLVAQALERGHSVTALARRPQRLKLQHSQLTAVAGDVAADDQSVARALPGHDVVLCALGRGGSLSSHDLMAQATPNLVSALERHGVRRLIYLSAYGVGEMAWQAPWAFRLMFRTMLADLYDDKAIAEGILRGSSLDWTILASVILTNGGATGRYRMGERVHVRGLMRIPRADVADAMLQCIDDSVSVRKTYIVAP